MSSNKRPATSPLGNLGKVAKRDMYSIEDEEMLDYGDEPLEEVLLESDDPEIEVPSAVPQEIAEESQLGPHTQDDDAEDEAELSPKGLRHWLQDAGDGASEGRRSPARSIQDNGVEDRDEAKPSPKGLRHWRQDAGDGASEGHSLPARNVAPPVDPDAPASKAIDAALETAVGRLSFAEKKELLQFLNRKRQNQEQQQQVPDDGDDGVVMNDDDDNDNTVLPLPRRPAPALLAPPPPPPELPDIGRLMFVPPPFTDYPEQSLNMSNLAQLPNRLRPVAPGAHVDLAVTVGSYAPVEALPDPLRKVKRVPCDPHLPVPPGLRESDNDCYEGKPGANGMLRFNKAASLITKTAKYGRRR
ncbi:hypothetical protein PG985_014789 [Apiospora marii]|uniref:uncharacterized protein n=1 Tax=Apiospora marii TaxID=335849 RepID=UPI00312EA669